MKFKIDLIVWKCVIKTANTFAQAWFKIDLIVWKFIWDQASSAHPKCLK